MSTPRWATLVAAIGLAASLAACSSGATTPAGPPIGDTPAPTGLDEGGMSAPAEFTSEASTNSASTSTAAPAPTASATSSTTTTVVAPPATKGPVVTVTTTVRPSTTTSNDDGGDGPAIMSPPPGDGGNPSSYGPESTEHALSTFNQFRGLNGLPGLAVKPAGRQCKLVAQAQGGATYTWASQLIVNKRGSYLLEKRANAMTWRAYQSGGYWNGQVDLFKC